MLDGRTDPGRFPPYKQLPLVQKALQFEEMPLTSANITSKKYNTIYLHISCRSYKRYTAKKVDARLRELTQDVDHAIYNFHL